jgi:hypothetical protein
MKAGQFVGVLFEFHQLKQFHGAVTRLARLEIARKVHRQGDVFDQREHGQQLERLIDHTHRLSAPERKRIFIKLVHRDLLPPERTMTSPLERSSTPLIMFSRVDFPAPDFPTIPKNSPCSQPG